MSQYLVHLGTNIITIIPNTVSTSGVRSATSSNNTLTLADAQAISTQLPEAVDIAWALRTV